LLSPLRGTMLRSYRVAVALTARYHFPMDQTAALLGRIPQMNEHSKGGGGAIVVILIVVLLLGFFVLLCVGAGVAFLFIGRSSGEPMGGPVLVRQSAVSSDPAYGPTLSPAPEILEIPVDVVTVPVHLEADGQVRVGDDDTNNSDVEDRLREERDRHGPSAHLAIEISAAADCPASVLLDFMRLCEGTGYCSITVAGGPFTANADATE
jgi:hypothetical protein